MDDGWASQGKMAKKKGKIHHQNCLHMDPGVTICTCGGRGMDEIAEDTLVEILRDNAGRERRLAEKDDFEMACTHDALAIEWDAAADMIEHTQRELDKALSDLKWVRTFIAAKELLGAEETLRQIAIGLSDKEGEN